MLNFFSRPNEPALDHDAALRRVAQSNIAISTIIDVGAAKGEWTKKVWRYWPNAHAHLLEAKEAWRADLEAFLKKHDNASFDIAGVSKKPGVAYFPKDVDEYGGAVFSDHDKSENLEKIKATSIDHEVSRLNLKGPYAIKLDTHGTEVDILDGARKTLAATSFLCVEMYNLFGQKRFPEMILDLEERGFRCGGLAEPMFRPGDQLLWQMDFYFLRADHTAFKSTQYLP